MTPGIIFVSILIVAVVFTVISRIRRLNEQSREIEKNLDYSKMKEWKDDED
ncbi:MAG: hypothetical protein HKN58_05505 [Xanthomonadales bacterium]|nr:hypothetical protein [Xanthomonadales bacterium]